MDPDTGRTFKSKKKMEKYKKKASQQTVYPVTQETPASKRTQNAEGPDHAQMSDEVEDGEVDENKS